VNIDGCEAAGHDAGEEQFSFGGGAKCRNIGTDLTQNAIFPGALGKF